MDSATLYEQDVLAWSEQQAAALRCLADRRDLPNQLDLANVIEEITDVGKSELRAVESFIENILSHLILLWAEPHSPAARGGRAEVTAWHVSLRRRVTPSMRTAIDLDRLWRDAVIVACAKLASWDETTAARAAAALGGLACPLDCGLLGGETLDSAGAVAKLPPA